jgi:hypothetical protein
MNADGAIRKESMRDLLMQADGTAECACYLDPGSSAVEALLSTL